jgi:hypothetical protein
VISQDHTLRTAEGIEDRLEYSRKLHEPPVLTDLLKELPLVGDPDQQVLRADSLEHSLVLHYIVREVDPHVCISITQVLWIETIAVEELTLHILSGITNA